MNVAAFEFLTKRKDNAANAGMDQTEKVCAVCTKQYAKYACPRCNLAYCSSSCYKNHGGQCTEGFNQDLVSEQMKGTKATEDQQHKMVETLQRIKQQDEEQGEMWREDGAGREQLEEVDEGDEGEQGEEGGPGGAVMEADYESLQSLSLVDEALLSMADLTKEQKTRFLRAVAGGSLGQHVEAWAAWWDASLGAEEAGPVVTEGLERVGAPLIQEAEEDEVARGLEERGAPPLTLSSFDVVLPPKTSGLLAYSVLDLLFAYCFSARFYNGDLECDPLDAAALTLALSQTLEGGAPHTSAKQVFARGMERAGETRPQGEAKALTTLSIAVVRDVVLLLHVPTGCLRALGHLYALLRRAASLAGQERDATGGTKGGATRKRFAKGRSTDAFSAGATVAGGGTGSKLGVEGKDVSRRARLQLAAKKVAFLGSWARSTAGEASALMESSRVEAGEAWQRLREKDDEEKRVTQTRVKEQQAQNLQSGAIRVVDDTEDFKMKLS